MTMTNTTTQNQTITFIKLKDLFLSKHNVRTVPATKEQDKLLRASIKAQGITQNLIVIAEGKQYGVIAGGRRLTQLNHLLDQGSIKPDYLVPCLIETKDNISAVSLAENIKATMHPADEFMAFQSMVDEGKTIADIANEFGITQTLVKKRLKLAGVAPEIIQYYRKGKIDLEAVMAFTVTDEHDKQLDCYRDLSGHYLTAYRIKRYLLDDKVSTDDALVKFVSLKAFKKAGGTVTTDLFDAASYINERELLETLALKKLEAAAKKVTGWKWVEVDLSYQSQDYAGQLQADYVNVPDNLANALKSKQDTLDSLYDTPYDEWTGEDEAFELELTTEIEALEKQREQYRDFTEEQKAVSGVVVSLNYQTQITYHQGLVKPEDKQQAFPKKEATLNGTDTDTMESATLKSDLHCFKQQALHSELLKDDALAYDLMVYTLAVKCFNQQGYPSTPFDLTLRTPDMASVKAIDETPAYQVIETAKEKLALSWLSLDDEGQQLEAFRALSTRQKKQILTFCMAQSYRLGVVESIDQHVTTQLDFSIANHWQPTKDNYFSRVKKDALLAIAKEHISETWTAQHAHLPKGKLVVQIEAHQEMAGWLPQSMM